MLLALLSALTFFASDLQEAEALFEKGNLNDALRICESLEPSLEVGELELKIAERLSEKSLGFNLKKIFHSDEKHAEEIFFRLVERYPGSLLAGKSLLALAEHYSARHQFKLEEEILSRFFDNDPQARNRIDIHTKRIRAAAKVYRGPDYDSSVLNRLKRYLEELNEIDSEAVIALQTEIPLLARLDKEKALCMLARAKFYRKRGDLVSEAYILRRMEELGLSVESLKDR